MCIYIYIHLHVSSTSVSHGQVGSLGTMGTSVAEIRSSEADNMKPQTMILADRSTYTVHRKGQWTSATGGFIVWSQYIHTHIYIYICTYFFIVLYCFVLSVHNYIKLYILFCWFLVLRDSKNIWVFTTKYPKYGWNKCWRVEGHLKHTFGLEFQNANG